MITTITTYPLPKPMTQAEARRMFLSTAPGYRDVTGLFRKYYYLAEDGKTLGGVYLWNSRVEAEAMFNDEWRTTMRGKYNTDPSVVHFDCPVVVDNLSGEILSNK
ncbi:monooxygenase [Bradyrhizobium sp.]|uniref:monooxygenase n=1 Tax=Bradyrhizobium sp. TaxID=376 RepID=UPI002D721B60|nr:monooxygenase [Bradyrhizobium sp.]HZR75378.1 monooxygenase [Bradyrhizobium sp.]